MNAQRCICYLEAGQALTISSRDSEAVVLLEGEVWVHSPACWIAETFVQPKPTRVSAPAKVTAPVRIIAVRYSSVLMQDAPPNMWKEVRTMWIRLRRLLRSLSE